ncbi:MAG: hypothetical protein NC110_05300 [Ruminococcus sp.]|nr:hypothetical protein [Ruminococcus sp.]
MLITKLPDTYRSGKDSVFGNLFQLFNEVFDMIASDVSRVFDMVDIDKAKGNTLDFYGVMLNQRRGSLSDEQYRRILLLKSSRNNCKGTYNDVVKQMAIILNCDFSDIVLNESENGAVSITKMPLQTIVSSGLSANQIMSMLQKLLPIGVKMQSIDSEGTFEFSDATDEKSNDCGFADNEQTMGGYFGMILGQDNETILPI